MVPLDSTFLILTMQCRPILPCWLCWRRTPKKLHTPIWRRRRRHRYAPQQNPSRFEEHGVVETCCSVHIVFPACLLFNESSRLSHMGLGCAGKTAEQCWWTDSSSLCKPLPPHLLWRCSSIVHHTTFGLQCFFRWWSPSPTRLCVHLKKSQSLQAALKEHRTGLTTSIRDNVEDWCREAKLPTLSYLGQHPFEGKHGWLLPASSSCQVLWVRVVIVDGVGCVQFKSSVVRGCGTSRRVP